MIYLDEKFKVDIELANQFNYKESDDENDYYIRIGFIKISFENYKKFKDKTIDFLSLIKTCNSIFIIEKNWNNFIRNCYEFSIEEYPKEYLPLKNFFLQ